MSIRHAVGQLKLWSPPLVIAALLAPSLGAQTGISIAFNSSGISSLKYGGTQFLSYGGFGLYQVTFQNADSTTFNGSTTGTVVVDPIGQTQTTTYSWGSIVTAYSVASNRLSLSVTVNNQSSLPIQTIWFSPLGLQFPSTVQEYNGTIPLVQNTLGQPAVQSMTYSGGVMALADDDVSKPLMLGFPWALNSPTNTAFPLLLNTGAISMYPNSYPNITRPIAAYSSDQYKFSLRFGATGATKYTLASDVYQGFASAFPATLNWPDRRPIGQLILATSGTGWATNPRGWLLDPTINVTTAAGIASLKTRILAWAQASVTNLLNMNAQGMVTWDIEGEQFPQDTSYVCDPSVFEQVAPEMAGIADAYFQVFQNAGLRVGVCIRPQNFTFAANLSSASQSYVTDPGQVTQILIDKVTYARNRWGATLFYMDSNVVSATNPNPIDSSIIQTLQQTFPDCLFLPEHSVTQYWAYSAPYLQLNQGFTSTPPDPRFIYPEAFTNIYVPNGPIQADFNTLVTSVQLGDLLMFRAWFDDEPTNQTVTSIYQAAGSVVRVFVNPSAATISAGATLPFSATVAGSTNQNVTWSVTPAGQGSISSVGLYTAPSTVTAQQLVTVIATSAADGTKSGSATVTLSPHVQVSISATAGSPQTATVGSIFPTALQAIVKDSNGNLISGATVTFSTPTSGPGATFGGLTSVTSATVNGVATAPPLTANGQAGAYTATAAVSGLGTTANFSLTNMAAVVGGGSLSGSGTSASTAMNLTLEGGADWVHWGDSSLNRKTGVTAQVSNYTIVGGGAVLTYNNDSRPLSWTDGTPTASSTNNTNGIYINSTGNGFSISAPAQTTPQTLTVHVGGYFSGGMLTAHLSDNSAANFVDTTAQVNAPYDRNYTLTYSAASAGQTLTVTWVMTTGTGNVTLNAAALAGASITATAGTPQSTTVNTSFGTALQATVMGASNTPVSGVTVTFTVPTGGATASFTGPASAVTNTSGVATSSPLTANGVTGAYTVTATVSGMAPANFSLTNSVQVPASIAATSGTPQSATVSKPFSTALQATVKDGNNNPISGVTVTFAVPVSGPSASSTGATTAVTNSNGVATASPLTANGIAGTYVVTATVSGVAAPANFSLTNVAVVVGGGSLYGSGTSVSTTMNLTAEGTADWVHWGDSVLNRKSGVTAQISSYAIVGSGLAQTYNNDPRPLSWTDGTPTTSGNDTNGIYISAVGNGFAITVPAGTTAKTLTVHVGGWNSVGTLTAHLSDNSAANFVDTTVSSSGSYDRNYTLTYSTASAGQTLTVSWVMTSGSGTGNVTLNGAALGGGSITPTAGTPQSTPVNTPFGTALQASVRDANNNPVSGVTVTFTVPTSGPSASFAGAAAAVTNASGVATASPLTANGQMGTYNVTATVSGAATASFSLANTAQTSVPASGGSLSGSGTSASTAANLTSEGGSDWVHWGDSVPNRKSGVTAQISTYTIVGAGVVQTYNNDPRPLSWTDGSPTASSTNNTNGVYVSSVGNGFSISAPADTTLRTLTVHVGGWDSGGTLTAHLSDGSALDFTDTTSAVTGQYDRNYTIIYRAGTTAQTLKVSWIVTSGSASGNVTMNAAALQ
jgi:hypothetical protein